MSRARVRRGTGAGQVRVECEGGLKREDANGKEE